MSNSKEGTREEGFDSENTKISIRDVLSKSMQQALYQVHQPSSASKSILETIHFSISSSNQEKDSREKKKSTDSSPVLTGKPYNVELRLALKLYHQWKLLPTNTTGKVSGESGPKQKRPRNDHTSATVTITSDLGLTREISSPRQLAELLAPLLEEDLRHNPHWGLAPDVRCQPSGVISLITVERSQELRNELGMLPCPHCIKWCKGEKGLWWHQQLHHKQEHAIAAAVAQATGNNDFAMVVYKENGARKCQSTKGTCSVSHDNTKPNSNGSPSQDPFDCIRHGDLEGLQRIMNSNTFQPFAAFDRKGATPLMWAAGTGHLDLVRYLIEHCQCDPHQPQKGKRSFAGRTALHWAARNGHLDVVEYLVSAIQSDAARKELIEASTSDGTTAFGWACWQRHLDVMQYLHQQGSAIDSVNSFGCSPVLWCSQGVCGNGLKALQWLQSQGCNMKRVNNNGHGVLHKAAQRGQQDVVEWFVNEVLNEVKENNEKLVLIGPDTEGYCPSDLAGMEGHSDLAVLLASTEIDVSRKLKAAPAFEMPNTYGDGHNVGNQVRKYWTWEKYGGLRRMKSSLSSGY